MNRPAGLAGFNQTNMEEEEEKKPKKFELTDNLRKKLRLKSDQKLANFLGVGLDTISRIKNFKGTERFLRPYKLIELALDELSPEQITKIITIFNYLHSR